MQGRTYSRVLIFPNGPLTQYLRTADAARITAPPKYYVAFTRARQSVALCMPARARCRVISSMRLPAQTHRARAAITSSLTAPRWAAAVPGPGR